MVNLAVVVPGLPAQRLPNDCGIVAASVVTGEPYGAVSVALLAHEIYSIFGSHTTSLFRFLGWWLDDTPRLLGHRPTLAEVRLMNGAVHIHGPAGVGHAVAFKNGMPQNIEPRHWGYKTIVEVGT